MSDDCDPLISQASAPVVEVVEGPADPVNPDLRMESPTNITAPRYPVSDWPMAGHLLGLPPSNTIHQIHWCHSPIVFSIYDGQTLVYVERDQVVSVNGHYTVSMDTLVESVLFPAMFSSLIGESGVRVQIYGDRAYIMIGCNRAGIACDTYAFQCIQ